MPQQSLKLLAHILDEKTVSWNSLIAVVHIFAKYSLNLPRPVMYFIEISGKPLNCIKNLHFTGGPQ